MPSVVTANHLRSGAVVYLTHDGDWVNRLDLATPAEAADDRAHLAALAQAAVERNEVTAVYAFEVCLVDGTPTPVSVRERIRATHAIAA